jgi:hypothetical protein
MAGLGGSGDASAEDISKDPSGDSVVAVCVGPPATRREKQIVAVRVTEAVGPPVGRRDGAAGKGAGGEALHSEVGGEELPKLESGEGIPLRRQGIHCDDKESVDSHDSRRGSAWGRARMSISISRASRRVASSIWLVMAR